jgi:hypothetical protein
MNLKATIDAIKSAKETTAEHLGLSLLKSLGVRLLKAPPSPEQSRIKEVVAALMGLPDSDKMLVIGMLLPQGLELKSTLIKAREQHPEINLLATAASARTTRYDESAFLELLPTQTRNSIKTSLDSTIPRLLRPNIRVGKRNSELKRPSPQFL